MPKRTDIQRILILGAGPIVIGQACEFDYSGSQACRALMEEGYEVILVNSNPATIMTDPNLATRTYIEPLTVPMLERIIEKERPCALLPTMGGQTALNLAFALHEAGTLERFSVELIGANIEAITVAEDREAFKQLMNTLGFESMTSQTVTTMAEAYEAQKTLGLPLIVRPAFTLGGSGGSVVYTQEEFEAKVGLGLELSPISQVLLEESALGWKEYEFEVMRDQADNVVIVCSVENVDPMGVHTGDSITVAPAQTLSDVEYQTLRNASQAIIRAVGVDAGGCNIQFAIHPQTGKVVIIEMNPRVSRSSALVSKATGVPIAKISARLAVGLCLHEIPNDMTRSTPACFEPAVDYVVTKIPRFSFDKFPEGGNALSPQMKSVGEVMAIGRTFRESFQKAIRGLEITEPQWNETTHGLTSGLLSKATIEANLMQASAERIYWLIQALRQGFPVQRIQELTQIDPWFLVHLRAILDEEVNLCRFSQLKELNAPTLRHLKQQGLSDTQLAHHFGVPEWDVITLRQQLGILPVYKAVDTCAGEFEAETPYFYSTYDPGENEAPALPAAVQANPALNKRVVILGGGPNRIGQGIEFDYCCVHAAMALKTLGYEPIMVNSNPETVSTDYDISTRLYFEPLTPEDVSNLLWQEQPLGVIAQLGGQTPLKLARSLRHHPLFKPLGTSVETIDAAEDRELFKAILEQTGLKAPASGIARTEAEAVAVANTLGYPLMVRPSYVLGGRAMRVVYSEASLRSALEEVFALDPEMPVLLDSFLEDATELDVDAVSDGTHTYIGAVLEHIEQAGIHSGDSACVWPPQHLSASLLAEVERATSQLAEALGVKGLLNIQFAVKDDELFVLEVNPRGSRTVPFVSKCTGRPLVLMALRVMLGESLPAIVAVLNPPNRTGLVAVKEAVFPFIKFRESDPKLGPEMRSTGEVMGLDTNFAMAYAKALQGAGYELPLKGTLFLSVSDREKPAAVAVAQRYHALGFEVLSTQGTAAYINSACGLAVKVVSKKHEGGAHTAETLIEQGGIQLVVNTPSGDEAWSDGSYIRKAAVRYNIPMTTTLRAAMAMAEAIEALRTVPPNLLCLQEL